MSPETFTARASSANATLARPKVFPEPDYMESAYTQDGNIATPNRVLPFHPRNSPDWADLPPTNSLLDTADAAVLGFADERIIREKRGAVLGKCVSPEFRECRGGDALKEGASSYVRFDQFDKKATRGVEGRGTCDGIVHEAMRRIDQGGGLTDLPSAVTHMRSEINGGRATATEILDRIRHFQDNPGSLGLRNYAVSSRAGWNPSGPATQAQRIDDLLHNMGTSPGMPAGGLAYIGISVQRPGEAAQTSGHVLLVQRLFEDARGSASRYAIFDPNNGVFTYDDWQHTETALRGYLDSAYSEDGYSAAPDLVRFYGGSERGTPAAASHDHLHVRVDTQLEPPELAHRPLPGHDEL